MCYNVGMNNLNNFLEDEEIMEEIVEEIYEEEVLEEEQAEVLTEAERRIEQANLYQALLKHDLFGPGSARQEIIDAVRKEFKAFILSRLEILLGIKPEVSVRTSSQEIVKSPFSEDEIKALRAIAERLTKKEQPVQAPQVPTPVINSVAAQPQITQVPSVNAVSSQASSSQPQRVVKKVVKKVVRTSAEQPQVQPQVQQTQTKQASQKGGRRKTGNSSEITGEEYSQAVVQDDPKLKPMPMPGQAEIDMMNAKQAHMNASGRSPVQGEADTAGLGQRLAATFIK